jgi:hypothetical protein
VFLPRRLKILFEDDGGGGPDIKSAMGFRQVGAPCSLISKSSSSFGVTVLNQNRAIGRHGYHHC